MFHYAQKTEKPAKKIICYNFRGEGHVVEHEDGYDSDVDDGPHANVVFMANLSATDEQGTSSSHKRYTILAMILRKM
uniref:Uncharacterized protein n=1 Tax=Tanacetum cinerariifolium TaxID=118510 RepID=A0A699VIC7_TANCI|nr:hypothetical protein [Tanacetum cinerariifolium]